MDTRPQAKGLARGRILAWLLGLALLWGCGEAAPPTPQAQTFSRQLQSVLAKLADPLAAPVAYEDREDIQKVLVRLFGLCAAECENLIERVVVLDRDGVTISFYPPKTNPEWRFADYEMVRRAMREKKPVPGILYRPDGTAIYAVAAPLLHQAEVQGVMVLMMEREKVTVKKKLKEEEFLALTFKE